MKFHTAKAVMMFLAAMMITVPGSEARAQRVLECEATFVIYNNNPALNLLSLELTNNATFFDPADLIGYRSRRDMRMEWVCSPFDEPCNPVGTLQQTAVYQFSDGAGKMFTSTAPGMFPEPLVQIEVIRPMSDPGIFETRILNALDLRGNPVDDEPLICFAGTDCLGTNAYDRPRSIPLNCADPNGDGRLTATDALAALNDATGLPQIGCEGKLHVCDVDESGKITTTDAMKILQRSTAYLIELQCPLPPNCNS